MSWETQLGKALEQLRWSQLLAQSYVMRWWGVSLYEFPTPLHPWLMALYWSHEGAEKYRVEGALRFAPARHVLTNYPEAGPGNLTARNDDDEVERLDVHPYHIRSHAWACQAAFWEGRRWADVWLRKYGYAPFDQLARYDQLSLLLLHRSIGGPCARGIMRRARMVYPGSDPALVIETMEKWLRRPGADTTPFDGAQDTEVVRLRFAWCTRMVSSPVPELYERVVAQWPRALPPLPRPDDLVPVPGDFHERMEFYARQAKREGPMPTGPWPTRR